MHLGNYSFILLISSDKFYVLLQHKIQRMFWKQWRSAARVLFKVSSSRYFQASEDVTYLWEPSALIDWWPKTCFNLMYLHLVRIRHFNHTTLNRSNCGVHNSKTLNSYLQSGGSIFLDETEYNVCFLNIFTVASWPARCLFAVRRKGPEIILSVIGNKRSVQRK